MTHTPVLTGKGKLVVLLSCCFHVEGVGDTVGGGIRWVGGDTLGGGGIRWVGGYGGWGVIVGKF